MHKVCILSNNVVIIEIAARSTSFWPTCTFKLCRPAIAGVDCTLHNYKRKEDEENSNAAVKLSFVIRQVLSRVE
jgi:hypothetical protein